MCWLSQVVWDPTPFATRHRTPPPPTPPPPRDRPRPGWTYGARALPAVWAACPAPIAPRWAWRWTWTWQQHVPVGPPPPPPRLGQVPHRVPLGMDSVSSHLHPTPSPTGFCHPRLPTPPLPPPATCTCCARLPACRRCHMPFCLPPFPPPGPQLGPLPLPQGIPCHQLILVRSNKTARLCFWVNNDNMVNVWLSKATTSCQAWWRRQWAPYPVRTLYHTLLPYLQHIPVLWYIRGGRTWTGLPVAVGQAAPPQDNVGRGGALPLPGPPAQTGSIPPCVT